MSTRFRERREAVNVIVQSPKREKPRVSNACVKWTLDTALVHMSGFVVTAYVLSGNPWYVWLTGGMLGADAAEALYTLAWATIKRLIK